MTIRAEIERRWIASLDPGMSFEAWCETVAEGVPAVTLPPLIPCTCEHADHWQVSYAGREWPPLAHEYLGVEAGDHRAPYVGPVCDDCAAHHFAPSQLAA